MRTGRGAADAKKNGLNWQNGTEFFGGLLGLAGNGLGFQQGGEAAKRAALAEKNAADRANDFERAMQGAHAPPPMGSPPKPTTAQVPGLRNCFPAGTAVATERGFKPIETIETGEAVCSYDFQSGRWVLCRVAVQHSAEYTGQHLRLFFEDGSELAVTADHPIWVLEGDGLSERPQLKYRDAWEDSGKSLPGRWVHSQALRVGDRLYGRGGVPIGIVEIQSRIDSLPVYNLTVLGLPYYAVGPLGILVHNSETPGTGGAPAPQGAPPRLPPAGR